MNEIMRRQLAGCDGWRSAVGVLVCLFYWFSFFELRVFLTLRIRIMVTVTLRGVEKGDRFLKDGKSTAFWHDRWLGSFILKEKYPRLFALDTDKSCTVFYRVDLAGSSFSFNGSWLHSPRGRSASDMEELSSLIENFTPPQNTNNVTEDSWLCTLTDSDNSFTKQVSANLDMLRLQPSTVKPPTKCNRSVPLKVELFVWRAKLHRLPVKLELDKRGLDLGSVLCNICQDSSETTEHILATCPQVKAIWLDFYKWWNFSPPAELNVADLFSSSCSSSLSSIGSKIWEATKWVCGYSIWRYRNLKIFQNQIWDIPSILADIQLSSFKWISGRIKKAQIQWSQWLINPNSYCVVTSRVGIG
ncbi:uncharacterized protein [Rutidosis leptorrhynchoides]|uniref:uncharacterized protein n=1 Tax=Rutidosis leptorrhynchoides TaxID=125765 RepID=UPI003A9940C2